MSNVTHLRPTIDLPKDNNEHSFVGNGGGGGGNMESRVAKLESDVEYIKRDIGEIKDDIREIKGDQKSLDKRIGDVEQEIKKFKTVVKATGAIVSIIFVACAAVFGTYVNKILDAINGIVLQ